MGVARLLLALSVVLAHFLPLRGPLVDGHVAVQCFFIISGFYMALILDEKYHTDKGGLWLFYSNRLLRLFPVYLCVLTMAVLLRPETRALFANNWESMNVTASFALVGANLSLFGQDLLLFMHADSYTGGLKFTPPGGASAASLQSFMFIPQAWTLGLELVFYVIAPFLLKRRLWVLLVVVFLSLGARIAATHAGLTYDPWVHRFFPFELVFFLFGSIAYRAYRWIPWVRLDQRIVVVLGCLPLALIFAYPLLPHVLWFATFLVDQVTLIVGMSLGIPFLFEATRRLDIDQKIGDLSYPLYICHLLVIGVAINLYPGVEPLFNEGLRAASGMVSTPVLTQIASLLLPAFALFTVAVALILSYLLSRWVDRPVNRFRQRRSSH